MVFPLRICIRLICQIWIKDGRKSPVCPASREYNRCARHKGENFMFGEALPRQQMGAKQLCLWTVMYIRPRREYGLR